MMLVVMSIAASCEKVEEVNSVPSGQDANKEIIDPDRAEELKFVGYWTLTVNYDIPGYRDEYEFRFYEDGTGHKNIDTYNDYGKIYQDVITNIATDTTTRADTNNIPFNTLSPGNSLSASPTIRLLIGRLNTIAATHSQKLSSNAPCSMTSL